MFRFASPKKSPSARQALSATGYILDLFHTEATRKLLKMIPIRFQFLQFNVKITDMTESLGGRGVGEDSVTEYVTIG